MTQPHPPAHLLDDPTLTWGTATDAITRWHEETEYEVEAAWHDGYQQALTDVAARHVALGHTWARHGQRRHQQLIADRIHDMETHAITNWPGLDNGGTLPTADWDQPARALHLVAGTEAA